MDKRKLLIAANIAIAIGGTSFMGFVGYKVHEEGLVREHKVVELVRRFHGCPGQFRSDKECFTPKERQDMFQAAEKAQGEGRFGEAGMGFARLNMEVEAREMGGKATLEERRKIDEELKVRQEALRRAAR
jgi:hypothetical protein